MTLVRNPSVANQFYPGDAEELKKLVNKFLIEPARVITPKAIIVPHAGYIYSGIVAGKVYGYLKHLYHHIKKVVLLGPAHHFGFSGIATSNVAEFATPLGIIPTSANLIEQALEFDYVQHEERAFNGEHCLEVQLPFLQSVLDDFSIASFVVGQCDYEKIAKLIDAVWGDSQTLIVISSDLSHFLSYNACQTKDRITVNAINSMQYQKLNFDDACGRLPIQGLLKTAQKKKLNIKEIDVINSGDSGGDKQRVVGYGGWVLYP